VQFAWSARRPAGAGDCQLPCGNGQAEDCRGDRRRDGVCEGLANEVEKTLTAAKIKVLPREKGTAQDHRLKAVLTKVKGKRLRCDFLRRHDATGGR